jgi:serine/threonine protein kinase
MSLTPGARLGPYEVTGAIGSGGMGEVYRARDTKLNRDVAIEVLPAAFADDPERLARFIGRRSGRAPLQGRSWTSSARPAIPSCPANCSRLSTRRVATSR